MSGYEQRIGDFRAICDRSGFKCWNSELVTEWTGLRVLARFSEPRHPQDFVRGVKDNPAVYNPRPDTAPSYINTINQSWILAQGVWNDAGVWDDNSVWQDAAPTYHPITPADL